MKVFKYVALCLCMSMSISYSANTCVNTGCAQVEYSTNAKGQKCSKCTIVTSDGHKVTLPKCCEGGPQPAPAPTPAPTPAPQPAAPTAQPAHCSCVVSAGWGTQEKKLYVDIDASQTHCDFGTCREAAEKLYSSAYSHVPSVSQTSGYKCGGAGNYCKE